MTGGCLRALPEVGLRLDSRVDDGRVEASRDGGRGEGAALLVDSRRGVEREDEVCCPAGVGGR